MEAIGHAHHGPESGLEELHEWLTDRHLDDSAATLLTDSLWFYYWYHLWPRASDGLTVAIDAVVEPDLAVVMTVPFLPQERSGWGVPERDVADLREGFVREVVAPVGGELRAEVRFAPQHLLHARFNSLDAGSVQIEREYHSAFVGDLLHDLRSVMPAEALRQWIDAPNSRLGGATPRENLRAGNKEFIRDLILEARHGLPA